MDRPEHDWRLLATRYRFCGLALILAMLALVGCGVDRREDGIAHRRLVQAVERAEPYDMQSLTSYRWDRLVLAAPYTPQSEIDKRLGFRWDAGDAIPSGQDDQNLLIFVRRNEVVGFVEDFNEADAFACLPREIEGSDATVEVHQGAAWDPSYRLLALATSEGRACSKAELRRVQ